MDGDDFPSFLRKIADIAGVDAALAISRAKGGMQIDFPSEQAVRAGNGGWLVDVVGLESALAIARDVFPNGGSIEIPLHQTLRRGRLPKISELSGLLQEIAEVAGVEVAIAIARAEGGREVNFPVEATIRSGRGGWLVDAVGEQKALLIIRELFPRGGKVIVPMDPTPRLERISKIIELLKSGKSVREVVLEVGCCIRTVHRYRARIRRQSRKKGSC